MTPYDSDVFEQYTVDPEVTTGGGIVSPTTSELEEMLKAAQAAKMDVHIRGHLYISQEYQDKHGPTFGGYANPTNPQKFFDNYARLWLKLVPLLNKYHVKLITPFTEMDKIEKYPELIKEMYTKISEQFDGEGEIGFEEETGNLLQGTGLINSTPIHSESAFARLVKNFTFWDWKDSKGRPMRIEYSSGRIPVETQRDQRVSVMEPNFVKFWSIPVDYYRETYPQDPQMFGELCVFNVDGQSLGVRKYYQIPSSQRIMDKQERADYILAALKGSKELGISSLNLWGDFTFGDSHPLEVGRTWISTGHYDAPASPMYRVFTAVIKSH